MIIEKKTFIIRLELNNQVLYTFDLNENWEPITIGRAADNTWQVNDPMVDSHHARIEKKKNKLILSNIGKKGVFLLEKKIEDHAVMHPGEVYRIGAGNCRLSVEKVVSATPDRQKKEQYHRLEQLTGENKGMIYLIRKKEDSDFLVIGSGSDADIVINESWISRKHALLEVKPEGCFIFDGDKDGNPSRNGTKVEQEPVSVRQEKQAGRQLQDGQIVSMAHVDLRFWDKDAVHIRSHFFYKLAIVLMTVAIVVGGYYLVLSMFPSARKYRIQSENKAAECNFKEAWSLIEKALTAPGADADADQRKEFIRKLEIWEKTSTQWDVIRGMLLEDKDQDWKKVNAMFVSLTFSDNENWKWNLDQAPKEKEVAQNAHDLISAMMTADDFLRTSGRDFTYLDRIVQDLSRNYATARKMKTQFPALMRVSDRTLKEVELIQNDYKRVTAIMDSFNSADKVKELHDSIQSIRTRSAEHVAECAKKNMKTSSAIVQRCDELLIPLEILEKTGEILQKNYEAIAKMEFDKFTDKLTQLEESSDAFGVKTKLTDRRTDMLETLKRQQNIFNQMKSHKNSFDLAEIVPGQVPPLLEKLFDEENLEKILNCDCLNGKMPGPTDKETESVYDEILGVNDFYQYLNSLGGGYAGSSDRVLFRSLNLFTRLNTFLDFCYARNDKTLENDMAIIRGISPDNRVMELVDTAEVILDKKKKLIRKLMQTALTQPDDRKGIIAGGMVCKLKDKSVNFVPDDFPDQIYRNHTALHRKVGALQDKLVDCTPEERRATEEEILSLGVPGDSFLRQPWSDKFDDQ